MWQSQRNPTSFPGSLSFSSLVVEAEERDPGSRSLATFFLNINVEAMFNSNDPIFLCALSGYPVSLTSLEFGPFISQKERENVQVSYFRLSNFSKASNNRFSLQQAKLVGLAACLKVVQRSSCKTVVSLAFCLPHPGAFG